MKRYCKGTVRRSRRLLILGGITGILLGVATPFTAGQVDNHSEADASSASEAQSRRDAPIETLEGDGSRISPRPRLVVRVRVRTQPPRSLPQETPAAGPRTPGQPGTGRGNVGATRTGMRLFPPPDTPPPHKGVIVPEDFELPPGYIRHYQTTDEGKALPAVLMFHPDYDVVDEFGNPVPVPENRVVPPEMVPPGLPMGILEVPSMPDPVPSVNVRKQLPGEEQ